MKIFQNSGVAIASADVMSWTLRAAGPVVPTAHSAVAMYDAIPANKRRAAAVVSVNRGST